MRSTNIIALFLALICISFAAPRVTAQEANEKFSALAYLPSGAGPRMAGAGSTFNVDIYIERYSSDEEAKILANALREGGSEAVQDALEKMKSIGKITLTGRVGFYDLKFIRSHANGEGRRIYALTDRPISGLEMYYSGRSTDYDFGIMQLDVKPTKKNKEKGEGALIYAAKLKVIDGNKLEVETYGISPIQLRGVQKLK